MPPCAASKRPSRAVVAPVNAPFSWPNSSASRIDSGIAAQLTATNGPFARAELSWSARASSSLPVPLSPSSSTVASLGAACIDDVHRAAPRERRADDRAAALLGELGLEAAVLDEQRLLLERVADDPHDVRALERLGDEVVRAFLHRVDRGLDRAVRGHQHDLGLGRDRLGGAQQVHAGRLRHHQIGEQHADAVLAQEVERRLLPSVAARTLQALALEDLGERLDDRRLVIDDQHDAGVGRRIAQRGRLVRLAALRCRPRPGRRRIAGRDSAQAGATYSPVTLTSSGPGLIPPNRLEFQVSFPCTRRLLCHRVCPPEWRLPN